MVPGFLLKRLYVKKSLRNSHIGFDFQLKNNLGSGYAQKLWPLKLDGVELPIDSTYFSLKGQESSFAEVSADTPFTLPMNEAITVQVTGVKLKPGVRKIEMAFDVPGLGTLRFSFNDIATDE